MLEVLPDAKVERAKSWSDWMNYQTLKQAQTILLTSLNGLWNSLSSPRQTNDNVDVAKEKLSKTNTPSCGDRTKCDVYSGSISWLSVTTSSLDLANEVLLISLPPGDSDNCDNELVDHL